MYTETNSSAYRDIGRVANAAEPRTCVLNKGTNGNWYFVICSRSFLVVTDLHTKECGFYPFPDGHADFPFGSMGSKTGKVYLGAGKKIFEFDLATREYTFADSVHKEFPVDYDAWTMYEADDGILYFGTYSPHTLLSSFDPKTRECVTYGQMDPEQSYLGSVAIDKAGWLYCGIGTASCVVKAMHLQTGEIREVYRAVNPPNGAVVCNAFDGEVYCTFDDDCCAYTPYDPKIRWYRLYDGALKEEMTEPFTNQHFFPQTDNDFFRIHCPYEDHPTILEHDLVHHMLRYIHPDTGEEVNITLNYESDGVDLSPLAKGPDGRIYGTTNHPFQFYTYDPKSDTIVNYGQRELFPLGNICAYASQGDILAGAAYDGGHIVHIDTTQPLCTGYDTNPHYEGSFREIGRPRSSAVLPDGRNVIFGGYNSYGRTGGGLLVYDTIDRSSHLIENKKLIPGHSSLAIVSMSASQVLCGTCIDAPGGGIVIGTEAAVYLFDLKTETVLWSMVPIPGARTISHMKMDRTGLVHGITSTGIYFALDATRKEVLCTQDLSAYGRAVRDGMIVADDGTIYGLLAHGIYRITAGTPNAELLSVPPCDICAGMAIIDNTLYFGANNTHLWSYTIEQ